MPLPKLSPLQSRLAASLMASLVLLILWLAFSSSHFADATELNSILRGDRNHDRLQPGPFLDVRRSQLDLEDAVYEADFLGYDEGIIGRAPTSEDPTALINNRMVLTNIVQGTTVSYSFLKASLYAKKSAADGAVPSVQLLGRELPTREAVREDTDGEWKEDGGSNEVELDIGLRARQEAAQNVTLYLTVNVCSQPTPTRDTTIAPPPQLRLYISQSEENANPGPGQDPTTQDTLPLWGGAIVYSLNATGDVFIGLHGENTTEYQGVWSAQIAASIDAPYHFYHDTSDPNLYLVDSDSGSALLITKSLNTSEASDAAQYDNWLRSPPPYVMFGSSQDDSQMAGIQNSYCGLENYAAMKPTTIGRSTDNVQTGITARGLDTGPKQQFYMTGLKPGSAYHMVLAVNGNSTANGDGVVGGGGQVWPISNFTTLTGKCLSLFCESP